MRTILLLIRKYLFAGKSSLSINIIASVSILGLAIGTAALIIVLSVFNGFEELLTGMFSKYNPDIKIVDVRGRNFSEDSFPTQAVKQINGIQKISRVYEQSCLFQYDESQDFGTLRGVDENYASMISLDSAIVEGKIKAGDYDTPYAYLGIGIGNELGVSIDNFLTPLKAFTPGLKEGKMEFGNEQYKRLPLTPVMTFSFHQEADYEVVITDLGRLRNYIGDSTVLSSVQIRLESIAQSPRVVQELKKILGSHFLVKDRYQQDEAFLRIMNLEKWLYFTLFLMTMLLVSFTIVGTLWMAVLEKRMDIAILKSLGMMTRDIQKIYYGIGFGIGALGMTMGFILAMAFYTLQNKFALIKVPDEFIIDTYPISMRLTDFIIVGLAVFFTVSLACILPARKIRELDVIFRED